MKLQQTDTEAYGHGMGETIELTMNLDGMMFHNMISGIYSDKIAAPIRELSTNARDGHQMVDKLDVPFDIHLPTRMQPEFYVRDYGCSMGPDMIKELYAVVGLSDKRESNDVTGCLGLGSKSPWAYTTSFNVTCWKDGRKITYAAYKQANGKPAISEVNNIASSEPTGVKVGFAVKTQDVEAFNQSASKVLIGFNPRPNVLSSTSSFKWDDRKVLLEGDNYKIYESEDTYRYNRSANSYAVQGSVAYPLDTNNSSLISAIKNDPRTELTNSYNDTCPELEILKQLDIIISFDIGKLQTTTSREELAYDDETCKNIVDVLISIIEKEKKKLDERYKKCKDLREAQIEFSKNHNSKSMSKLADICKISTSAKYKGTQLAHSYMFIGNAKQSNLEIIPRIGRRWTETGKALVFKNSSMIHLNKVKSKVDIGTPKTTFPRTQQKDSDEISFLDLYEDTNFFVEILSENIKNLNNKLRQMWCVEAVKNEKNLWFTVPNLTTWKAIQRNLMIKSKNVKFIHELEDFKMPKIATHSTASNGVSVPITNLDFRCIIPRRWGSNSDYNSIKIDLATNKEVYPRVYQKGNKFYESIDDRDKDVNSYDQVCLMRMWDEFKDNSECDVKSIIVLNTINAKYEKVYPAHFISLEDYRKETLKQYLPHLDEIFKVSDIKSKTATDTGFYEMFENIPDADLPKLFAGVKIRTNFLKTHKQSTIKSPWRFPGRLLKAIENDYPDQVAKVRAKMNLNVGFIDVQQLKLEHPILRFIIDRGGYHYSDNNLKTEALLQFCKLLKKDGK